MDELRLGKIPIDILGSSVLRLGGKPSKKLAMGPRPGVDFAAIKLGPGYMVISADPITGATRKIGGHAVQISANDVATSGNAPQFLESVVMLPEGSSTLDVGRIANDAHQAARKLGITIVGGHTEVTPGLRRPIVVMTAFSFVKRFAASSGAKEGDAILMTKTAGVEGTAILGAESPRIRRELGEAFAQRAGSFERRISIVREAVLAFGTGFVHAMHDCTEGGVLGGVYEMSLASGLGFVLDRRAVPVARETRKICDVLGLDPLKLIGSGSLLISVRRGKERRVAKALEREGRTTVIGRFVHGKSTLIDFQGNQAEVKAAPEDELWRAIGNGF